jgi:hypothetical protein
MIQYIAYVGPKTVKQVQNDSKTWHEFPQGVTVDALQLGFSEDRIKVLIKSGVFQWRSSDGEVHLHTVVKEPLEDVLVENPPPMEPPRHICGCGFIAKSDFGLRSHQRACKK